MSLGLLGFYVFFSFFFVRRLNTKVRPKSTWKNIQYTVMVYLSIVSY